MGVYVNSGVLSTPENRAVKLLKRLCLLMVIAFVPVGCDQANYKELSGQTMGTTYHIKYANLGVDRSQRSLSLADDVSDALEYANAVFSTYRSDSEISVINESPINAPIVMSSDMQAVALFAQWLNDVTAMAFDPTIDPLVNAWGFGAKTDIQSLVGGDIPDRAHILHVQKNIGFNNIALLQRKDDHAPIIMKLAPVTLDFSSIAKGYAVDKLSAIFETNGVQHYMIEIGGELRCKGKNAQGKPWQIGIETPTETLSDKQQAQMILSLSSAAVATSGDYRNYYEKNGKRFSHIIDPRTGYPIEHALASVTVISDSAMVADGWATALMVLGEQAGMALANDHGIAATFISRDNQDYRVEYTQAMQTTYLSH